MKNREKEIITVNPDIKKESIAAVVVTYNRKELLTRCLDALSEQAGFLDKIIIVDNASTDGTAESLKAKGYIDNPLIEYIRLRSNTGGAGGFYEGINRGYNNGYDWLWLMDDDGFPDNDTLERFCSMNKQQRACYCPLVKDSFDRNRLAFGFYGFWKKQKIFFQSMDELDTFQRATGTNLIDGYGNFFNGIFISREIVKTVGLPRKQMFIWGDENEYLFRILSHGFRIFIMLDFCFYHPGIKELGFTFLGKRLSYIDMPTFWKYYYLTRNSLYINRVYRKQLGIKWAFLKDLILKVVIGLKVKTLRKYIFLGLFDQILGLPYKTLNQLKKCC